MPERCNTNSPHFSKYCHYGAAAPRAHRPAPTNGKQPKQYLRQPVRTCRPDGPAPHGQPRCLTPVLPPPLAQKNGGPWGPWHQTDGYHLHCYNHGGTLILGSTCKTLSCTTTESIPCQRPGTQFGTDQLRSDAMRRALPEVPSVIRSPPSNAKQMKIPSIGPPPTHPLGFGQPTSLYATHCVAPTLVGHLGGLPGSIPHWATCSAV